MVQRDILIEDLVREVPGAVKYLMNKGIQCLACGEPLWGTLEQTARAKGFSDDDITQFEKELTMLKQCVVD